MKSQLTTFNFNSNSVRTLVIDNKPYFVAKDVAEVLSYLNTRDAISSHCKGVVKRDTLTKGGVQSLSYIPEGDVYRLVMRSKLPSAEDFQDWVCDEVLPQIRSTGEYTSQPKLPDFNNPVEAARAWADTQEKLLLERAESERLEAQLVITAPKVETYDRLCNKDDSYTLRDASKLIGFDKQKSFTESLKNNGYLTKASKPKPTQKAISAGYLTTKGTSFGLQARVTFKGIEYFSKVFHSKPHLQRLLTKSKHQELGITLQACI